MKKVAMVGVFALLIIQAAIVSWGVVRTLKGARIDLTPSAFAAEVEEAPVLKAFQVTCQIPTGMELSTGQVTQICLALEKRPYVGVDFDFVRSAGLYGELIFYVTAPETEQATIETILYEFGGIH